MLADEAIDDDIKLQFFLIWRTAVKCVYRIF